MVGHVVDHRSRRRHVHGLRVRRPPLGEVAQGKSTLTIDCAINVERRLVYELIVVVCWSPQEKCDYVIALTHMRTPNDCRLAENVDEIDLILGGHDHDYEVKLVNNKYIIKSGTDFRQFSKITLTFNFSDTVHIDIKEINVNSADFGEDANLKAQLNQFSEVIEGKMDTVLGHFGCDLDGRFASIRTQETNLGKCCPNWPKIDAN